jgi:hypothetical protein
MWSVAVSVSVVIPVAMTGCKGSEAPRSMVEPEATLFAEPLAPPIKVARVRPAASYDEPNGANGANGANATTALSDGVRAAMQEAAGTRAAITADPRLDMACRALAALAAREAPPRASLVEFVLSSLGIAEPADRLLVAWDVGTPEPAVGALRAQFTDLEGYLRVGAGTAPDGPVIAIVVRSSGVVFSRMPRAGPARDGFDLVATLDRRLGDPHVIVTRNDGSVEHPGSCSARVGRFARGSSAASIRVGSGSGSRPRGCGDGSSGRRFRSCVAILHRRASSSSLRRTWSGWRRSRTWSGG